MTTNRASILAGHFFTTLKDAQVQARALERQYGKKRFVYRCSAEQVGVLYCVAQTRNRALGFWAEYLKLDVQVCPAAEASIADRVSSMSEEERATLRALLNEAAEVE